MKRTSSAVIAALTIATIAATAEARSFRRPTEPASDSHTAATRRADEMREHGESQPDPPPPADMGSPPRSASVAPDPLDWSNPYDLMLHGIPIGNTRDMR